MRSLRTPTMRRPGIATRLSPRPGLVVPTATLTLDSSQSLLGEMVQALSSVRHFPHLGIKIFA